MEQRGMKAGMRRWVAAGMAVLGCVAMAGGAEAGEMWYACKYCGHKAKDVRSLTGSACQRHPDGSGRGRHALYEGGEKSQYTCKWCGRRAGDIGSLTGSMCQRHPAGPGKGRHEPAL